MPISAHNAVVTCSVFAPNPNRILDQILRNTTGLRSEEAELEEVDAEDTRSEPAVDKAAAGARSKHSKAKQPQHHVRAIFVPGQWQVFVTLVGPTNFRNLSDNCQITVRNLG